MANDGFVEKPPNEQWNDESFSFLFPFQLKTFFDSFLFIVFHSLSSEPT